MIYKHIIINEKQKLVSLDEIIEILLNAKQIIISPKHGKHFNIEAVFIEFEKHLFKFIDEDDNIYLNL